MRFGDTRRALKHAKKIGCTIKNGHGDEIVVSHPSYYRRATITSTRKDTPRCLLTLIKAVENGGRGKCN